MRKRRRPLDMFQIQIQYDQAWEERFKELLKYKDLYGTVVVPNHKRKEDYPAWEVSLASWVTAQRGKYNKNELADWRYEKLVSVGFDFAPIDTANEKRFVELKEYKDKYGHVLVPQTYTEIRGLGGWVSGMRYKNIRDDYRARLDELGFIWAPLTEHWQNRFRDLAEFKRVHGHCNVTKSRDGYLDLANWVFLQRKAMRLGNFALLTEEKIKLLDSIGFNWEPMKKGFEQFFNLLLEFHHKYHHFNVPLDNEEYYGVGGWAAGLRKNKHLLPAVQIEQLDAVGFNWDLDPEIKWRRKKYGYDYPRKNISQEGE